MSADSLDESGQSKGLQISGVAVEWERCQALRAHLRVEGAVMFDKDMAESIKQCCKPWVHGYLQPLLVRMAETDQKLQPLVEPLRDEISNLYNMFSKQVESSQVIHDSWMTRKFLGFVKMKARKEHPSTDLRREIHEHFSSVCNSCWYTCCCYRLVTYVMSHICMFSLILFDLHLHIFETHDGSCWKANLHEDQFFPMIFHKNPLKPGHLRTNDSRNWC